MSDLLVTFVHFTEENCRKGNVDFKFRQVDVISSPFAVKFAVKFAVNIDCKLM